MRRLLYFLAAAGLVGATTVALASASRTAPHVTPGAESSNAYLPAGEQPAGDNWTLPGGDTSSTAFSQLKQINSTNVTGLKVAWTASLQTTFQNTGVIFPGFGFFSNLQQAPICCPDNLMIHPIRTGVIAISPADGHTMWTYAGVRYNTVAGSATQVQASRGISWSPKTDYVYAGQQDGSVVALKAKTGAPVWTAQVSAAGTYGAATGAESAPFTQYYDDGADGIILAAPNGGESPYRGHLDAYNAKTGALVWRTWTTPDPTQVPAILTWGNPAEASQGGGAVWSIPAVDTHLGLVYFGTGNLFPWTGRAPGDNLWGTSLMAVDYKTGALRWYHQEIKHDVWDWDSPQPPTRMNVPIDGKMTPVVAEGGKDGYLYVLNAANGAYLPHFTFKTIQTYDPSGRGIKLNGLSKTQIVPEGAAGCVAPIDQTLAGLAKCGFRTDRLQIAFGGPAPKPGVEGSYGPGVQGANGTDACPTCAITNPSDGKPIIGTTAFAAHTSDSYFVFNGDTIGPMNYPFKTYSPLTHDLYLCVGQNAQAHSNTGTFANGTESTNINSINGSMSDPRLDVADFVALDMTNNTFSWKFHSKLSTLGACKKGSISTAGNLVFASFDGRTDQTNDALLNQGIAPGGLFVAFDATTGKILWQWGNPGSHFASHPITYMYKGKQYVAIYTGMPGKTDLPGGLGSRADGGKEQMTVFSL